MEERLDGLGQLIVEDDPVCHDDDRVERDAPVMGGLGQLVHEPRDRVGLAATRRVLDEILSARPVLRHIGEQAPHCVELMVAGEDRLLRLLARGGVLLSEDLGIVLDDPGETLGGQNPPPQVVRHDPVRVGRVARAIVVSLVKRQEPRRGALQLGTELHPLVIDCKVRERTPEGEQQLLRVAVPLVLNVNTGMPFTNATRSTASPRLLGL